MLTYDEERIILEGPNLILKQFGKESFKGFTHSFFENLSIVLKINNKSSKVIDLNYELEENLKLKPNSICLTIIKENKVVITLMLSKRKNQQTSTEEYFGLDLCCVLKTNNLQNLSLFQLSKLSIRKGSFKDKQLKYELVKLLFYYVFQKMLSENVSLAFAGIHQKSAKTLNKLKIKYEIVTPDKEYRGVKCFGIIIKKESLVSFLDYWDFDKIINNNFSNSCTNINKDFM